MQSKTIYYAENTKVIIKTKQIKQRFTQPFIGTTIGQKRKLNVKFYSLDSHKYAIEN
jgi:FKBP-type peptidyl-prolyl cis-trans isomerase (trigger factor)